MEDLRSEAVPVITVLLVFLVDALMTVKTLWKTREAHHPRQALGRGTGRSCFLQHARGYFAYTFCRVPLLVCRFESKRFKC